LFAKEVQKDLMVALDVEIKEIEKKFVDLKEKEGFDCFWSSHLWQ
jgi:hypothetical protein